MIVTTVITLLRIARWADGDPQFAWLRNLSISLLIGAAAVFACGAFIGIAYQPVIWYVFAATVMLNHHMKMCERGAQSATARGVADPMGAGAWASPGAA
jgi:hypothetical protein